jgi:DNA polymerase
MKAQILGALRKEWANCDRCKLHKTRTNVVFGDGNPDADILIVGEGPGATEDEVGEPFQGDAGKILDEFLDSAKLDREHDCYITNIVACRPIAFNVDERTGEKTVENRIPSKSERQGCWPRLWRTIYTVDPLLIVTVGKTPLQVLTSKTAKMGKIRGRVQTMTLEGLHTTIRYPVMPIYHTAYLSRNHDHRPEGPWGQTARDFVEITKIVDHLREVYYNIKNPDRWGRKKRGKEK